MQKKGFASSVKTGKGRDRTGLGRMGRYRKSP